MKYVQNTRTENIAEIKKKTKINRYTIYMDC